MTGDIDPCRHPCTTLVLPLVLGVRQVTVAAIQKRLQSFFASSAFLCPHSRPVLHTTRPVSFTPHALQPFMLHTTRPGSLFCFTPRFLQADFASHHTSSALHTTHPRSRFCLPRSRFCFTPLVLRASHHSSCGMQHVGLQYAWCAAEEGAGRMDESPRTKEGVANRWCGQVCYRL